MDSRAAAGPGSANSAARRAGVPACPLLAAIGLVALFLAGCGAPFGLGQPSAPQLSAPEIVQKAGAALAGLNSFHFDLSTDTGGKPAGAAFNLLAASGSVAKPDKLSADLQVAVAGFTASVKYVSVGGKHYMTDPISLRWSEVPPQFNTIALFSPDQGVAGLLNGM
ncbi:MAG: LppX_LprAFG lipoprotein, partial [Chloroflexota bacterium]|nr:LppX_LprAFG lipoprotein [Chloroflexota bacterium]